MDGSGGSAADRGTGVPRWVKVSGVAAAVVLVLVVALLLLGDHGPGRHGAGGQAPGLAGDGWR